jgi:plastocyanin
MRKRQSFLLSLVITLLFVLAADIAPASAHGYGQGCLWHYVRRGETLSSIGRQYGWSWRALAQVNGLANPNLIRTGSYLCIPAGMQPSYGYKQPSYGYKQPSYGYEQPSYGYEQPSYGYEQPSYDNMAPGYGNDGRDYGKGGYGCGARSGRYKHGTHPCGDKFGGKGHKQPMYPPATPQPPTATPPAQAMVVVQVRDNEFVPNTVTIRPGDMVIWMRAEGFHNVRADDGSFGNQPSDTWRTFSQTFTSPGMVRYHCEVHGGPGGVGMSGVIIVQ